MSKRLTLSYFLDCGMMKDRSANIIVDFYNGKPMIAAVMTFLQFGRTNEERDIMHMLTLEALEEIRRFVWEKLKYTQAQDAFEWVPSEPDGAA